MHSSNRILSFSIIIFVVLATSQCSSKNSDELVKEGTKHSEKGDYGKIDAARAKKLDGKKKRLIKVALPTDHKAWYGFAFEEIKLNY